MSNSVLVHGGFNPAAYPSNSIWGDCNYNELARGDGGWAFHEDFLRVPAIAVGATGAQIAGPFTTFLDGTGSVVAAHTAGHAASLLVTDDNGMAAWVLGSNAAGPQTVRIAYKTTKFWFETRMKVVGATDVSTFIGLLGKAAAMNVALANLDTDTGVPDNEDVNFIGFNSVAATPTVLDAMYLKEDESAKTTALAAAHTYVSDTYVKLGLSFDGDLLKWWVNAAEVASLRLTSSTAPALLPSQAVGLTLAGIIKNGDANDEFLVVDWVRAAYMPEP